MSATDQGAAVHATRQRTGPPPPAQLTAEQREDIRAEVEKWAIPSASTLNYVALLFSGTRDREAA